MALVRCTRRRYVGVVRPEDASRLPEVTAALAALPEVRLAYLFGSRASGRVRRESDWDVAVLVDDDAVASPERWWGTFRRLASAIRLEPADIVLLNQAGVVLRQRVVRDGVLIFERTPEERPRFARHTIRAYQDGAHRRAFWRNVQLERARAFLARDGAPRG